MVGIAVWRRPLTLFGTFEITRQLLREKEMDYCGFSLWVCGDEFNGECVLDDYRQIL